MSLEQRQRRLLNAGTVLLGILLAVAATGALISVGRTNRVGSPANGVRGSLGAPMLISTLEQGAINCPYGASFSPDGTHVMILGTQGTCAPTTAALTLTPHIAAIYDTRSGVMTLYTHLEKLLDIDTSLPLDQQPIRAEHYFSLGWSPDGDNLAIVFTAFDSADTLTPDHEVDAGLILLDAEHGSGRVLRGDSGFFTLPGSSANGFPIWSTATPPTEVPAVAPDPGLAYAWSAHGTPYPIVRVHGSLRQLPITAGPRYPVGNPDGNSTFTIWQPGVVIGSSRSASAGIFTTVFPSWSPDGKYVTLINVGAQLPLAQPIAAQNPSAVSDVNALDYPTPATLPLVPARDAALAAVQRRAGPAGWALVAWNPAGTLLASINCHASGDELLEIRATDSAIIQGSATLPLGAGDTGCRNLSSGASAYPAQPMMVLWSPSGNQVMVCDQKAGTLTLWRVSQSAA